LRHALASRMVTAFIPRAYHHPVDAPGVKVDDVPRVVVLEDSSRKLAKSMGWVIVSFP